MKVEIAVLGAMLSDERILYECTSTLTEEHFSTDDTKLIFNKILSLSDGGKVTGKMVIDRLKGKEKSLVRTATSSFIDIEHFKRDIADLKDFHLKRQLNYILNIAEQQLKTDKKADKIADYIGENLSSILFGERGLDIVDPEERAPQALLEFYERVENPNKSYGLRFSVGNKGLPSIDHALLGAKKGDLILFGAKTGVGKTALGITIARLFSFYQDHIGFYANTEMRKEELEARMLAPIAGVTVREIDTGMIEGTKKEIDEKVMRIGNAMHKYSKSPLFSSRMPGLTVQKVRSAAKLIQLRKKNLEYVIVDYIQRMEDTTVHGNGEHDRLRKIAMKLKELAIELDIPIIMLGQRNEEGFIEGAKSIANECDAVFFFEPINEDDTDTIERTYKNNPQMIERINYKITKRKVRRDDNPYPLYVNFDKKHQFINEILAD